jgi:hypothetical protein
LIQLLVEHFHTFLFALKIPEELLELNLSRFVATILSGEKCDRNVKLVFFYRHYVKLVDSTKRPEYMMELGPLSWRLEKQK